MAAYLRAVHAEAVRRGYKFDASKIGRNNYRGKICEMRGQMLYEWAHLKRKFKTRDPQRYIHSQAIESPTPHPLFRLVPGGVRDWEKV